MNNKAKNMIERAKVLKMIEKGRIVVYFGNNILDVTDFRHPGPKNILKELNGMDIKTQFDDQGHSKFAKSLLSRYKIGQIKDNVFEEL